MAETPDVTAAASSTEGEKKSEDVTRAAPSTAEGVTAASPTVDRGLENMFRELQRRDQDRQKQIDSVLAWIGAQAQQRPVPQTSSQPQGEPSDEELWALAQQGDRQAFETYQRRIARREVQQQYGQQSRAAYVANQLAAIANEYPVLRDPSHPLTQTVHQQYAVLLQAGYPAGVDTMLEAVKTSIVARKDLVVDLATQGATAREQTRQSASTRAQAGVTGSTVRQGTAPAPQARITQDEAKLASRMGIKDPKAAKARFLKRQESGQSNLGAVGGYPSVIAEMEEFDKS